MEGSKIKNFEKAPYLELKNYNAPLGINSYYVEMDDGIKIRVCYWLNKEKNNSGTILLQQGHNEFIEKYFETINEFLKKGFSVIAFDWRGQGMSGRMIKETEKSYIKNFERHDKDFDEILKFIEIKKFPTPYIGIGHSMGGCLMLSAFYRHPKKLKFGILSAPMLGFKNEGFLRAASSLMNLTKKDTDYLIGSKPNMGVETPFNENDLTGDSKRYERTLKLVRKYPSIRLWGITNSFAKAVNQRFKIIRKKGWVEKIETKVLVINSLEDKVVDSKKTIKTIKRLKNYEIINFKDCEHEIFMERDIHRKRMWNKIDKFLSENM
jgi:lysophospholipase